MRAPKISYILLLCLLVVVLTSSRLAIVNEQEGDYYLKTSDEELVVRLSRADYIVKIELTFAHARQLDYVVIEKNIEPTGNFRQCKYIQLNESVTDNLIVSEKDNYPLSANQNVYYRVKTVTKEGISRTYPVVRLPALELVQSK